MRVRLAGAVVAVSLGGCSSPVAKLEAIDPDVLALQPLPGRYLEPAAKGERRLVPGPGWLADVDPAAHLTFAGYRQRPGVIRFAVVAACEPEEDRLVLLPLEEGETPLDVVADERRRRELTGLVRAHAERAAPADVVELSIERAVSERLLGPPLPTPRRIFAVAANIPSHLAADLAIDDPGELRSLLGAARPRVFLKHPPTPPPDDGGLPAAPFQGVIGPYDEISYPGRIALPREDGAGEPVSTATSVDYEVEIGVVIGRALDRESARDATDDELRRAAAGLLLVSDAKARNPQVLLKVRDDDRRPAGDDPYAFGDDYLDAALGLWTEETCRWWSYAAGCGDFASLGPFFVATPPDLRGRARAVLSARSYGPQEVRGSPVPKGRATGVLYLRQGSVVTEDLACRDALFWTLPQIIRSILGPDNALAFAGEPRLETGDVICLGTPGGTVITSKPYGLFDLMEDVVFIWDPLDWHDVFFKEASLYLRSGDRLFLWAQGLGYQLLTVREAQVAAGD